MPSTLRNNLTSGYLEAAARLSPRKQRCRIVAYVESYDDVAFWRALLSEFEDETRYFQVMLPSSTSLAKGKKTVLMNTLDTEQLGRSLIACVDSDYDFLMQGSTATSRKINENPYILQTYGYAIESYLCYAESLHEVCVRATLNDRHVMDFPDFLRRYSQTVYPLFLWNVWFYRSHDTKSFPIHDLSETTRLKDISLNRPEQMLDDVARRVRARLLKLQNKHPKLKKKVEALGPQLEPLGLTPDTTYLYMQGHHIMDNVVQKLLVPVCTQLRREREAEIKRLSLHSEQLRNELTSYENSLTNVSLMLKKNDAYKELFLYQWMRRDVQALLEKVK